MKTEPLQIIDKLGRFALIIVLILIFFNAQRIKITYTPYQMLLWEIKANEGYRGQWYKDGFANGKQAYSIGFGYNDCGSWKRRKDIAHFTSDGVVTFDEATKITVREVQKYGKLHNDPYRNLALQLYSYNCGLTKDGKRLGRCCGGNWLCGRKDANIRRAHNRRRLYELALWKHDVVNMNKYTEENKTKLQAYISQLNRMGKI